MTQDSGMDATPSWQQLHDEVERLRPLVDLYAASLKKVEAERDEAQKIAHAVMDERDALAAHVECARSLVVAWRFEEMTIEDFAVNMARWEGGSHITSIARLKAKWQAEALESLAAEFREAWPHHNGKHAWIIGAGVQIRRQAEGGDQ